ncbi:unnamed protein product, partial [Rotaria socialis]
MIRTYTDTSAPDLALKFYNSQTEKPVNTFNPTTSSVSLVPTQPISSSLLNPIT